jgi:hypothetical protein
MKTLNHTHSQQCIHHTPDKPICDGCMRDYISRLPQPGLQIVPVPEPRRRPTPIEIIDGALEDFDNEPDHGSHEIPRGRLH